MHLFKLILLSVGVARASGTTCSNGLSGLEKGGVCCPVECGTCGGTGCGSRPGLTKYDCCTSTIKADNHLCSVTQEAPCVIDEETEADPTCSNGVAKGDICCSAGCGYCGGSGCSGRGGLSGDECCTSTIAAANKSCDDQSAPCVMSGGSDLGDTAGQTTGTTTTTTTVSTSGTSSVASTATSCGGVAKGAFCCNAGCGTCGGTGCGGRGEGCCTSDAAESLCSATGKSPCLMDSASTTTTTDITTTTDTTSGTSEAVSTATSCGGVAKGAYCCNAGCGTCGGTGCGMRGEGCCTSDAALSLCSVTGKSPCLMDSASTATTITDTTTDTTSGISVADATATSCDGVSKGAYCCNAGCGTCGGTGCGGRGEGCCTSDAALSLCSVTGKSPCLMDSAIPATTTDIIDNTDTTTDTTGDTTSVASTATSCGGVASGYYCCNAGCGTCGGTGCGTRGDGCCASDAALSLCSATGMSPCLMETSSTSTTTTDTTTYTTYTTDTSSGSVASTATSCGGVAKGAYCCNAGCGTCGGTGCGTRGEGCCTDDAAANLCSVTGMSPCLMDSASTTTTTTVDGTTTTTDGTTFTSTCTDYSKSTVTIEIKNNVQTSSKKNGGKNYIRGGGCATLTDIYTAQGGHNDDGPLFVLDSNDNVVGGSPTGYWLLMRDIHVEEDSLLQVHGPDAGGDARVLRIQSTASNDYYEIRGHGGSLSFMDTKVTSWDTDEKEVNTNYNKERSFVRCVSEELADNPDTCDGHAVNHMGECRMDIIRSEMGEMGYDAAESYGISWKVRGYCSEDPNPELFERTRVRGDIIDSNIYGMYYGHYSFGHDGGIWTGNQMHDNAQYGFDPHDDSDNLEIAYNTVWGNGNHGIIASKRCNNVKIHHNTVYDGGEGAVGIFLHRSSDDCEVWENTVYDMEDAGMAIMESMGAHIYDNTFTNVKYGIRLSVGASRNVVENNKFSECDQYGIYTYQGNDEPEASKDWDGLLVDNTFHANTVEGGVKIQKAEGIAFTDNKFYEHSSGEEYRFEDCEDVVWTNNLVPDGICLKGDDNTDYFKSYDSLPDTC